MSIHFEAPVIFVKNIEHSREFYTKHLEQTILHDFGTNIMFHSKLSLWQISEKHEINKIKARANRGKTHELYFETDDILSDFQKIKASGSPFLHEIKTEPWGQQTFRFFDPDEHLIEIGESLSTFVNRIYKETGSLEETAKRTGIPENTIDGLILPF